MTVDSTREAKVRRDLEASKTKQQAKEDTLKHLQTALRDLESKLNGLRVEKVRTCLLLLFILHCFLIQCLRI